MLSKGVLQVSPMVTYADLKRVYSVSLRHKLGKSYQRKCNVRAIIDRRLIFISALMICNASHANAQAYKCVIEEHRKLSAIGELENGKYDFYVGKEFVVDRGTGRMSGILTNHASFGQPEVKDYGSSEQAFKVVTEFSGNTMIDYLYVQEFSATTDKPFFFVTSDEAFSGLCRDY